MSRYVLFSFLARPDLPYAQFTEKARPSKPRQVVLVTKSDLGAPGELL